MQSFLASTFPAVPNCQASMFILNKDRMVEANIVEANITSVFLLANGVYAESIIELKAAIQSAVSVCLLAPNSPACEQAGLHGSRLSPEYISCSSEKDALRCEGAKALDDENSFRMYDRACLFEESLDDKAILQSDSMRSQVAGVLLYNAALAFHLMAVSSASKRDNNYITALQTYELALKFHRRNKEVKKEDAVLRIDNFFEMAALNNMASICSHYQHREGLRRHVESLVGCLHLSSILDCDTASEHSSFVDDDVATFFLNVSVFYEGNHLQKAPAA